MSKKKKTAGLIVSVILSVNISIPLIDVTFIGNNGYIEINMIKIETVDVHSSK